MRAFDWKPIYTETIRKPDISRLCKNLKISRTASEVLIRRGYTKIPDVRKYLQGTFKDMYSPFLFPDMLKAVARILKAQKGHEKVLVHGDYDADGITATALIMLMLEEMGIEREAFIPTRAMGYGMSVEGFRKAIDIKATVLISCDCGSNEKVIHSMARRAGIDVIVLDHHAFQRRPKVFAFLNPEEPAYPFKDLCGAGVAFKLLQAMATQVKFFPEYYLDLAALATVADAVPLTDENRIIVKEGLSRMNATCNVGLRHLMKVSSVLHRKITPEIVGFILAPKLNASGRLDDPRKSLDLLLTIDEDKAQELALELARINKDRMALNNQIRDEAIAMVEKDYKNDCFLVLEKDSWHKGVIGIVASTMVEIYHKPCAIISRGYCSIRTVPEYGLLEPLEACSDLFVRWGGHQMAAGLKILKKNVGPFRKRINEIAGKILSPDPTPYMLYDSKLKLKDLTIDLVSDMERLEPFGNGNPSPRFVIEDVNVARQRVTKDGQHLQISMRDRKSLVSAIGFWMSHATDMFKDPAQKFDALFSLQRGRMNNVQIEIHDLKEVGINW